jgi:hypothetical protein
MSAGARGGPRGRLSGALVWTNRRSEGPQVALTGVGGRLPTTMSETVIMGRGRGVGTVSKEHRRPLLAFVVLLVACVIVVVTGLRSEAFRGLLGRGTAPVVVAGSTLMPDVRPDPPRSAPTEARRAVAPEPPAPPRASTPAPHAERAPAPTRPPRAKKPSRDSTRSNLSSAPAETAPATTVPPPAASTGPPSPAGPSHSHDHDHGDRGHRGPQGSGKQTGPNRGAGRGDDRYDDRNTSDHGYGGDDDRGSHGHRDRDVRHRDDSRRGDHDRWGHHRGDRDRRGDSHRGDRGRGEHHRGDHGHGRDHGGRGRS